MGRNFLSKKLQNLSMIGVHDMKRKVVSTMKRNILNMIRLMIRLMSPTIKKLQTLKPNLN